MTSVPTMAMTQAMASAMIWFMHLAAVAVDQAHRLAAAQIVHILGGEDAGENRSQRSADAVNAERVQRVVVTELAFTFATMKKQTTPAAAPISSAGIGFTKPEAGVIATSPATAPEMRAEHARLAGAPSIRRTSTPARPRRRRSASRRRRWRPVRRRSARCRR